MDVATLLALLREFGFPVVVAVWLMWRMEKRLDLLFDVVQRLLVISTVLAEVNDINIDEALEVANDGGENQLEQGDDNPGDPEA
jgi:hypothetical protein